MTSAMLEVKTESSGINWDNFPAGLRVMVVDDDELCLKLVEKMLQKCSYEVTTCNNATQALEVLRRRTQEFDLVLSDVYMPDMDGFKLLETIGLELDLPVIMMSSNGETTTVLRGVTHGAVDFLIKPVRIEELRNLWQHVVRRRKDIVKDIDSDEHSQDKEDQAESSKKRKDPGKDCRDPMRDDDGGAAKKPRVVWSVEMHQQFVNAVNQLGIDKAVPKKILELMNVDGLTRENVASHLQKYRLYLKRVAGVSGSSGRVKPVGPSVGPMPTSTVSLATGQATTSNAGPQNPLHNVPSAISTDSMPNPFTGGGLLPNGPGSVPFPNSGMNAMSAAQAAQAAQAQAASMAANMMGAINAMNLGVAAGAMGLSRLNNLGNANPNAAGAANMAMQLGMGGMSAPQLNAMGMGLNPGLGLSLPNMQGMGPMAMAQMNQLHLGMVGMNNMNGPLMHNNPLAPQPNAALQPPAPDQNPSLLSPNAAPQNMFPPGSSAPQQPAPPTTTSLAQELAMMESTSYSDFPTTSAPLSGPSEQPGTLDPNEFGMFDGFGSGTPSSAAPAIDMPMKEQLPMDDFLSFLLKDGNMQSEA